MTFLKAFGVAMLLMGGIFAFLMFFVRSRTRKNMQVDADEKKPLTFLECTLFVLRLVGLALPVPDRVQRSHRLFCGLWYREISISPETYAYIFHCWQCGIAGDL